MGSDPPTDARSLAATLAPVLSEACDGRLGAINWFKVDWQRGGAATGTATFENKARPAVEVVVKLPVVRRELTWTRRLQGDDPEHEPPVVPRLLASGEELGQYDLAWVVLERFQHGPLGLHWHDDHVNRIADAAARFYEIADRFPRDREPQHEPWPELLTEAREALRINDVSEPKRWNAALRTLRHRGDHLIAEWEARPALDWVHGDLHLANAMSRSGLETGPVTLIDLAEVRAGHWVEDAVYLERQLWTRPERVKSAKPVRAIALARKARNLPVDEGYPRLAMIRRALLAGTAPRFLKTEGDPRHLDACLDWLERALTELK